MPADRTVSAPESGTGAPPDLSIVIISHGHEALLPNCVASLLPALDGVRAEIVLIDNLQDGAVRAAFPQLPASTRLLENKTPLGFAANANRGAAATTGRHLLLLNPDTIHQAGQLAEAIDFLGAHPEIGALGCRLQNPDGTPQQNYRLFPTVPVLLARAFGADHWPWRPAFYRRGIMEGVEAHTPHPVDWVFGAFILMRRGDFDAIGGMDAGFRLYYEDVDLCYRLRRAGLATVMYPQIAFVHAHQRTSAKRPLGHHWRLHVRSAARYFWKSGYVFAPDLGLSPKANWQELGAEPRRS